MEKREVEEAMGAFIPDDLFNEALGHAERKQAYIFGQCHRQVVLQHWYLLALVEEYVRSLSFSQYTMDLCRKTHDMEKEHPAESRSAQTDNHIVRVPAM